MSHDWLYQSGWYRQSPIKQGKTASVSPASIGPSSFDAHISSRKATVAQADHIPRSPVGYEPHFDPSGSFRAPPGLSKEKAGLIAQWRRGYVVSVSLA